MIFLCILLALIVVTSVLYKKFFQHKWVKVFLIICVNLLLIEAFAFGYFLFLIFADQSTPIIGQQKFFDNLIKNRLVDSLYLGKNNHNNFYQIDNDLGYTIAKNSSAFMYRINNQGVRSDKEYSLIPKNDTLRIATFGDSFVFCDWEHNENTWQYYLENSTKNLEVMNFGVSGYGLSQSYLRYLRDGTQFHPDVIILNYVALGNRDFSHPRDINVVNQSLKQSTLYRPLLSIKDGELISKAINPLDFFDPRMKKILEFDPLQLNRRHKLWSSPIFSFSNVLMLTRHIVMLNTLKEADLTDDQNKDNFRVLLSVKILENIFKTAKKQGSSVILFHERDLSSLPKPIQIIILTNQDIVTYVNSDKILNQRFKAYGHEKKELLNSTNHYNAKGNLIYAETIAMILQGKTWGTDQRKFQFDSQSGSFKRINP